MQCTRQARDCGVMFLRSCTMAESVHLQAYDSSGQHIVTFDGEYLYDFSGNMLLRVDEGEVYDLNIPCNYVGEFSGRSIRNLSGQCIFTFSE